MNKSIFLLLFFAFSAHSEEWLNLAHNDGGKIDAKLSTCVVINNGQTAQCVFRLSGPSLKYAEEFYLVRVSKQECSQGYTKIAYRNLDGTVVFKWDAVIGEGTGASIVFSNLCNIF